MTLIILIAPIKYVIASICITLLDRYRLVVYADTWQSTLCFW